MASAQVGSPEVGANPFKSYSGGALDHIEMQNGNLFLRIPVLNLPQKGQLALSYSLVANGSKWASTMYCDPTGNCQYAYAANDQDSSVNWGSTGQASVQLVQDQALYIAAKQHEDVTFFQNQSGCTGTNCVDQTIEEWLNTSTGVGGTTIVSWAPTPTAFDYEQDDLWAEVRLYDATGAFHVLGTDSTNYRFKHATDGSGYTVDLGTARTVETADASPSSNFAIYDARGIKYTQSAITDPNGNQILLSDTEPGIVDSLGRTIVTTPSSNFATECPVIAGQPAADSESLWQVKDSGGNVVETYKICGTTVHVRTNFYALPGNVATLQVCNIVQLPNGDNQYECNTWSETDADIAVFQSLVLPNGTFWGFKYSQPATAGGEAYGDLTAVVLPSGGELDYTYSTVQTCGFWQGESGMPLGRVVSSRTASPLTGQSATTTYNYESLDTVESVGGNDIVHTFVRDYIYPNCGAVETDTQWYQGSRLSGTVLQEQAMTYQSALSPQSSLNDGRRPIINRIPTSKITTRNGVLVGEEGMSYDALFTDVQTHVVVNSGGYVYGVFPTQAPIYLDTATTVTDGITTKVTNRLAKTNSSYAGANLLLLPIDTQILDNNSQLWAKTTYGYDESGSPSGARGNATSKHVLSFTSGIPDSVTTTTYNSSGMPTQINDARGNVGETGNHTTTLSYDSTGIFVSEVDRPTTSGVLHKSFYGTDPNLGVLLWSSDENATGPQAAGHTTTYTYDAVGRATSAMFPDGGSTHVCFSDENISGCPSAGSAPYHVDATVQTGIGPVTSRTNYDGLGRMISKISALGTSGQSTVDTTYDDRGHIYTVSNPHTATSNASTDGLTTFTYDPLDRKLTQSNPDGSTMVQWAYSGNSISTTDEASKTWTRNYDLANRLVKVQEPGSLTTTYLYDPLGNLQCADQWGTGSAGAACMSSKPRRFSYDSMSRLITSTNPETGTICYGQWSGSSCVNGYDGNGNLLAKTDARGVTISYTYDALNRLQTEQAPAVSGSPLINNAFGYDNTASGANGIGRLWFTTTSPGSRAGESEGYSYDGMGRMSSKSLYLPSAPSTPTSVFATYDLAGNVATLTYPDGRTVFNSLDGAGRLGSVHAGTPASPGDPYVYSIAYNADGSPNVETLGNNVLQQTTNENPRLQVQSMDAAKVGGSTYASHTYCYSGCATGGTANNGNIWGIADNLNSAKTQGFTYDSLNRLSGFYLGGAFNRGFTIDPFGNMSPLSGTTAINTFDAATNHINNLPCSGSATPFDSAGNQLCDTDQHGGVRQYQYDGESRIKQIASFGSPTPFEIYAYDSNGNRIRKTNADGTYTEYVNFGGMTLAEKDENGVWTDYIYANGKKIARTGGTGGRLHIQGNVCCGGGYTVLNPASDIHGLVVQAGDRVAVTQFESAGTQAGVGVNFTDGTYASALGLHDQDGQGMTNDATSGQWHSRVIDLSTQAGKTVDYTYFMSDWGTTASNWWVDYRDFVYLKADGTVIPLYTGQDISAQPGFAGGMSNVSQATIHGGADLGAVSQVTVRFTNDSCSACSGTAPNQDRNLYVVSASVGSTAMSPSDSGVTCTGCSVPGSLLSNGDMTFPFTTSPSGTVTVSAYGTPDYGAYPHMQVFVNGVLSGEWDVAAGVQTYTVNNASPSLAHYYMADHLGTSQMEFAAGGYPIWKGEFAPFGSELDTQATAMHYKFTGKERDAESGLDYFGARYYGSNTGRFMSPDWATQAHPIPYARLDNPQSLNLYGYMLNNPLYGVDTDGHNPFSDWISNAWKNTAQAVHNLFGSSKASVSIDQTFSLPVVHAQEAESPEEEIELQHGAPLEPLETPNEPYRVPTWDMMNLGPLGDSDAARSFSGGKYSEVIVPEGGSGIDVYRTWGGKAGETGRDGTFYSLTPQAGGIQSIIDNAILPSWGNTAESVSCVNLPGGTTAYVGTSATQGSWYMGGTIQLYVPK
jgi:RHS repeat-associated protein